MLRVGELATPAAEADVSTAFARPKSRTLTVPSSRDLDVCRLQVPMDDALFVRRFEGLGDLTREPQRFVRGNRTARHALGQRLSRDQLHDQEVAAIGGVESVQRGDVRVIERGEHLRFALEPDDALHIREKGVWQHLDGNPSSEPQVACQIDLPIPPTPSRLTISYDPTRPPDASATCKRKRRELNRFNSQVPIFEAFRSMCSAWIGRRCRRARRRLRSWPDADDAAAARILCLS